MILNLWRLIQTGLVGTVAMKQQLTDFVGGNGHGAPFWVGFRLDQN